MVLKEQFGIKKTFIYFLAVSQIRRQILQITCSKYFTVHTPTGCSSEALLPVRDVGVPRHSSSLLHLTLTDVKTHYFLEVRCQ